MFTQNSNVSNEPQALKYTSNIPLTKCIYSNIYIYYKVFKLFL